MGRPPMDVRDVDPPSEAVRRLLLCIHGMGGVARVVEWLSVPHNTLSRYLYGREPTLLSARQMLERSDGLLEYDHWTEAPHSHWPPRDLERAYQTLLRALERD